MVTEAATTPKSGVSLKSLSCGGCCCNSAPKPSKPRRDPKGGTQKLHVSVVQSGLAADEGWPFLKNASSKLAMSFLQVGLFEAADAAQGF